MNMDFTNILRPTELAKIYNDIQSESQYQKDMQKYMNLGYAQGFIQAIRFNKKEDQEIIINKLKEIPDFEAKEYIIRLWEDG